MSPASLQQWFYAFCILGIFLLGGCMDDEVEETVAPPRFAPTIITDFNDPSWSPKTDESDPIVAEVGRATIHLSEVQRHVNAHEGALAPKEALDRLIEMEVLAQIAFGKEIHLDRDVVNIIKKSAIREMLHHVFIENHNTHNILTVDYERAYRAFIRIFEHFNFYLAGDAQFTCCYDSDIERCQKDPQVQFCMDAVASVVEWTREQLLGYPPFQTLEDFEFAVQSIGATVSTQTPLVFHSISFWYKNNEPYELQKGFTKLNTHLVNEIISLLPDKYENLPKDKKGIHQINPCRLGRPVRSNHGWHIPCLYGYLPERHSRLNDAGVREEIAEGIYPQIQKRDYGCFIDRLYPHDNPKIQKNLEHCATLEMGDNLKPTYRVSTSVNYDALDRLQSRSRSN